ncbi:SRSO17 transposase [Kutzneria viridogrisea]|uniref:SRSO17 transposase n=1 Tax=Kutzneria viridogrisea TaxID=47990 RepID=A0ABR6BVC0_9PSEU|nr:SRSO17 transposase [Kutzneria viridogrisea]
MNPIATVHPRLRRHRPTTRTPLPRSADRLKTLVMAAGRFVVWRHGSYTSAGNPTGRMRSRFLALRVRPADRHLPKSADGSPPECWLLAEWPTGTPEPTDQWLSTLPIDIGLPDMVQLAKIRWRIEHDYRELNDGLGLDHFAGRSWTSWHRHVTLASVAQAICTKLRRTPQAPAGLEPLRRPAPTPTITRRLDRYPPHLPTTRPHLDTNRPTATQQHLTKSYY